MEMTAVRNKIITYMNYGKLPKEMVTEIQETLLKNTKEEVFLNLLKKIEEYIKKIKGEL